jgi:hypothetical protein
VNYSSNFAFFLSLFIAYRPVVAKLIVLKTKTLIGWNLKKSNDKKIQIIQKKKKFVCCCAIQKRKY